MTTAVPNIEAADVLVFSPPIPFSEPDNIKLAANLIVAAEVDYDTFPTNNEMLCARVRLTGPFANTQPITITFQWLRVADNKIVFTHTGTVPTPGSAGWEWWNWYDYKCWIGKAEHEVNGPGPYTCFIEVKGEQGIYFKEQRYITVTGAPPGPQKAVLKFRTVPTGAEVYLNDAWAGTTPLDYIVDVGASYRVKITKEGYKDDQFGTTAPEAKEYTINITLIEEEAPPVFDPLRLLFNGLVSMLGTSPLAVLTAAQVTDAVKDLFEVQSGKQIEHASEGEVSQFLSQVLILSTTDALNKIFRHQSIYVGESGDPTIWEYIQVIADVLAVAGAVKALLAAQKAASALAASNAVVKPALSAANPAAIEGLAKGAPEALNVAWKTMTVADRAALHTKLLSMGTAGRLASEALFAATGPAKAVAYSSLKKLAPFAIAGLGLTWIAFEEIDIVPGMRKAAILAQQPADMLQQLRFDIADVMNRLESTKFSCDLTAFNEVIERAADINTRWDTLIAYADANPLSANQITALLQIVEERIGIGLPAVSTDFREILVSGKQMFNSDYEIEKNAVSVKCNFGEEEEPEEEIPGPPPEQTPTTGVLQVSVYAKDTNARINASLYYDNILYPYHLGAYSVNLEQGAHAIRVEETNYKRYEDIVSITKGKITAVNVFLEKVEEAEPGVPPAPPAPELPPEPTKGRIQVSCNTEAGIFIAGIDTGYKTPMLFEAEPGVYDITLKAEGYFEETKTAYVRAGEVYSLAFMLAKVEAGPVTRKVWRLDIDSSPSSAKISVNYSFTGKYTPDYVLLDPGVYIVSLTKSGFKRKDRAVTLEVL